ncbi:MAG: S-methyl-5'-thioinosine phosphorylase [Burkholderiales bacterium]
MLAIIGGSGLSQLGNLQTELRKAVRTPYGEPSGPLTLGHIGTREVVFLARHGYGHTVAPHQINYRANLWALKAERVSGVVAVASVGGIRKDLGPGALMLPDQIIDYTCGRESTFFAGTDAPVTHIDFTEPYSSGLRQRILDAALSCREQVVDGGVYAATQGPRLETAAEIDRMERDGADVVGMTGMPEAVLARELGLEYAAIAVVANYAAGRGDSARGVSLERIDAVLNETMSRVRKIIERLVNE